ncbi:MAG: UpxY family transcription antiterminator [Desulfamplus sp.]|nr:UpxY family transcription antiterminator [Desulfamplus sp.]
MIIKEIPRLWYALFTKSNFENVVNEQLEKKSIEVFYPKISVKSKRKDRKKIYQKSLFPGYLFVKTDLQAPEYLNILQTKGVVRLVGTRNVFVPVPDENIESLKIIISGTHMVTTGTLLKKGDRVLIINGPFSGVIGFFERYASNSSRVVVMIEALGQFVSVDVSEDDVEILKTPKASQ